MVGPRKRVFVDNQDISVTTSDSTDDGGSTDDNTLWFRSVDLSIVNDEVIKNSAGQITDINTQYDELEAEYDAQYGSGIGVVTDYDRTVVTESLNIDFEDHNTTHTRDSDGRLTEMEIALTSETVTYSFTWDSDDNLTGFDRTVT